MPTAEPSSSAARGRHVVSALALTLAAPGVLAACGGGDDGQSLAAVDAATSPALELVATEMAYDPDQVAVDAGTVDVILHNEGSLLHDLRIGDVPFIVEAAGGQTATAQVVLEPGRYEIFCSLPGHREAGMEGVLEVR